MLKNNLYRLISLMAVILFAISSNLVAHASTSPAPAQATGNSTRLAWFYKPPADGNLALIAQNYSTYIMTKGNESTRDQLIALGAQAPMLEYLRFEAIMDPGSCTAKPWQNNVAYLPGDFCNISTQHPDWFLLTPAGQRIVHITGTTSFYMMDPGNPGWRAFFLERISMAFAADPVWDGVFLDNVEVTNIFHVRAGETMAAYPDNASFQAAIQGFLQYLRINFFQPQGKLLYANLISRTNDTLFTSYMTFLDGAMHEGWAIDDPNRWRSVSEWETHLALVEQAQAMGKSLFLVSHGTQADLELQNFAYASYLLVANNNVSFRYADSAAYNQAWLYDNYQLQLGTPLGARYKVGTAWKRDFSNGSVSVDPGTHAVSIVVASGVAPTSVPPTATVVPPTATALPATATSVPPTATAVPPTATALPATATSVPPTATAVPPTATAVPPTATVVKPTATAVRPTATAVPTLVKTITNYENNNSGFAYSSGWKTVSDSKASGGSYAQTSTLKSSVSYTFTGSSFSLTYRTQSRGGTFKLYVDGKYYASISQNSSTINYQKTWTLSAANKLSSGKHTLVVVFDNPSGYLLTFDKLTVFYP